MNKLKSSVYWYVPNMIGYVRLILLGLTLLLFKSSTLAAVICYICSSFLDVFDGLFARVLKQSSNMGVMLDYCTDRLSLAVLISVLILTLPGLWVVWIGILGLDLFSHYCQLYFTVLNNNLHHKNIRSVKFRLLHLYYNSRAVLFISCLSNELFLGMVLLYNIWQKPWMVIIIIILIPGFIFKNWINILQIIQSIQYAVELDENGFHAK